jgi:hypothetical protein
MNMKPTDFIETMQRRTGVTAVGPSALRGQGKGVLKVTQAYLGAIDLSRIPKSNQKGYTAWLDEHTNALLEKLPIRNRPWGAARKALNLFMRDTLYNRYLNDYYKIDKLELWMEVPLDSAVAKGLKRKAGRGQLPQWSGLKNLKPNVSEIFQKYAIEHAKMKNISRVHLDVYLWMENR